MKFSNLFVIILYYNIIYYLSKVNSADCVDMDCDAKKKCMIKDLDGTLLGKIGTVIPMSEVSNRLPRTAFGYFMFI